MTNGTTSTQVVTQRCVPLSQGALSPDLRVNYEFGLVLGVDEMQQEQEYFLELDYLHNRGLHGYGTVCGLDVTLAGQDAEPQVQVSPGVAVDQAGRTFVVRFPQCASLNAWLAQQDAPEQIEEIFVVGRYDECLDVLVPIRGQPCQTSDQYEAASRIRRAFRISLERTPPPMPRWAGTLRLGAIMARVQPVPELEAEDSDEAAILELIRLIPNPEALDQRLEELRQEAAEQGVDEWKFLWLPEETLRPALDRLLTVWVTEVCPQLGPDLLDVPDDAETGILLARLERVPEGEEGAAAEGVVGGWRVDDVGRPYLLSTQTIQSLLMLGGGAGAPVTMLEGVRELVSLDTVIVPRRRVRNLGLNLWFHVEKPIAFDEGAVVVRRVRPDAVETLSIQGPTDITGANGNHLIWQIAQGQQGEALADGDLLEIIFNTDRVSVSDQRLTEVLQDDEFVTIGYDGEQTLTVFYVVDAPFVAQPPGPGGVTEEQVREIVRERVQAIRTVPFVTITALGRETHGMIFYELWFHADLRIELGPDPEVGALDKLEPGTFFIYAEVADRVLRPVNIARFDRQRGNVYTVFTDARDLVEEFGQQGDVLRYVRFVFPLESGLRLVTMEGDFDLREYMEKFDVKFEGFFSRFVGPDGNEMDAIVSYVRLPREFGG